MLALDDPVALAEGAAIFRRALARRTVSAGLDVTPGPQPEDAASRSPQAVRTA